MTRGILEASQSLVPTERSAFSASSGPPAIGQGDPVDFERVYELYRRRVYMLCLRMVRNTLDAEDLTQEAFLHLFHKIHTFRGESAFYTWLHRLVVNVVLMRLRKKTPPEVSFQDLASTDHDLVHLRSHGGMPATRANPLVERICFQRALNMLPAGSRIIFVLHDIQGYEHSEIARLLGRSVGNSKSQLHKARRRLRELLGEGRRGQAGPRRLAAYRRRAASVQ
jgi:RNA polymerase sigma-70 factor (ECF subfamily)